MKSDTNSRLFNKVVNMNRGYINELKGDWGEVF